MYSDADSGGGAGEKEESKGSESTALLSKSVLGGKEFKPGEEVVLQIVEVRDNDVVVKYASEEKGEEKGEESEAPSQVPESDAEMTSMME